MIFLVLAGHYADSSDLAVLGLTYSFMNIITMSLLVGVSAAQETLTA